MASRDQDKAAAGLLRGSLRDNVAACPEPEILAAYFERSLDADETARYELHLSQCPRCREQLAATHRAGELAPAGAAQPRQSSHWAWLWDWRFLAPAVAVLVIVAVWTARRPTPKPAAENSAQPLVAMSRPTEPPAAPLPPTSVPEQYSSSAATIPNKALTSPDAGAAGTIKQSPALTDSRTVNNEKKFAANQPLVGGNATEFDELKKDDAARKRDSVNAMSGAAGGAANSRVAATSAPTAAPPPPPATASLEPSRADSGVVGGRILDQEVVAKTPEAAKVKPSGAPTGVRPMTGAEQRQAIAQSQAVMVGAVERGSTGNIIKTPNPKVMWRIAEGGFVEHTTDGGATWQKQQLRSFQAAPQITAGYAPTANICWLVGRDGAIILTRDAAHWVPIPPPITTDFVGVTAKDNFSATVTAADGRKYSTDDAGDHWNPVR